MQNSEVQPQEAERLTNFIGISTIPNEVLERIFCLLEFQDIVQLNLVCKRWYRVARSDQLWGKFVPNYPGMNLPKAKFQRSVVLKLWKQSEKIGNERWFPNPLASLVEYDTMVRDAEREMYGDWIESKCVLYLRLNPIYPFTLDGKNENNLILLERAQEIFDKFGSIDSTETIEDGQSVMRYGTFVSKQHAMEFILNRLETEWYLTDKLVPPQEAYKLDKEGRILEYGHEDDENVSVQGRTRLSKKLFKQVRHLLAEKSERFLVYQLCDGCWNENFRYARHMVISDTAAIYCVDIYDL